MTQEQRIEVKERFHFNDIYFREKILKGLDLQTNDIQDKFTSSSARFKIFRAARRVGKSFTAAKDVMPDILSPGVPTRGWIVGPSYELAEKEFRYILDFLKIAHRKLGLSLPTKVRSNHKAGELYIETAWGSEVHGKSADKVQSLLGEELDWLILSESARHKGSTWEKELRPTLVSRKGRAIFPTTPDSAGIWLYELELAAENNPEWEIFHCPAWDCPHFDKDEIESAKKSLSEDAFYEQFGGEWRFYTGRVYKNFKSDVHLIEPFPIPSSWKIREGIDFGTRDATAVEFLAESPFGDFYFFDEHYRGDVATQIHVESIKRKEENRNISARVADYHALGTQLIMDWNKHGLTTVNCSSEINSRKARREKMISLFEPHHGKRPYHIREFGDNLEGYYPRLFIFKNKCPNLVRELMFLRWKEGTRREGSFGDTSGDDHAVDAAEMVLYYSDSRSFHKIGRKPAPIYKPMVVCDETGY